MELFPHMLSQYVRYWYIEKLMISVSLFCIMLPCCICVWCLGIFDRGFGFLRYRIISSATRDILTVSLLICIHFILLLAYLHWLEIPVVC
jgi:hypothetical protein